MKPIIIAVGATILIGGIWSLNNLELSQVYKAETVEKIIDKTPEWAKEDVCPTCVEAAKAEERRLELEARKSLLETEIVDIRSRADEETAVREAEIEEIDKELGHY